LKGKNSILNIFHSNQPHQNALHFGGSVQNKMPLQNIASGILCIKYYFPYLHFMANIKLFESKTIRSQYNEEGKW
jgi:hypothetical protein